MCQVSTHIIYKKVTGKAIPRIKFLLQLAEDLAKPHKAVDDTISDLPPPGVNLRKRQSTQDSNGRSKSVAKRSVLRIEFPNVSIVKCKTAKISLQRYVTNARN